MKKHASYHVNKLVNKHEEELHRRAMEKKIANAKSTLPAAARGAPRGKGSSFRPSSRQQPQLDPVLSSALTVVSAAMLDDVIAKRLVDILGQPLVEQIQGTVMHGMSPPANQQQQGTRAQPVAASPSRPPLVPGTCACSPGSRRNADSGRSRPAHKVVRRPAWNDDWNAPSLGPQPPGDPKGALRHTGTAGKAPLPPAAPQRDAPPRRASASESGAGVVLAPPQPAASTPPRAWSAASSGHHSMGRPPAPRYSAAAGAGAPASLVTESHCAVLATLNPSALPPIVSHAGRSVTSGPALPAATSGGRCPSPSWKHSAPVDNHTTLTLQAACGTRPTPAQGQPDCKAVPGSASTCTPSPSAPSTPVPAGGDPRLMLARQGSAGSGPDQSLMSLSCGAAPGQGRQRSSSHLAPTCHPTLNGVPCALLRHEGSPGMQQHELHIVPASQQSEEVAQLGRATESSGQEVVGDNDSEYELVFDEYDGDSDGPGHDLDCTLPTEAEQQAVPASEFESLRASVAALNGLVQKKIGHLVRQSMVQNRRASRGDQGGAELVAEASSAVMLGEEESFARLGVAPGLDSTLALLVGCGKPDLTGRHGVEQQQVAGVSYAPATGLTSLDLLQSQLLHDSDLDYLERLGAHTLTTSHNNKLEGVDGLELELELGGSAEELEAGGVLGWAAHAHGKATASSQSRVARDQQVQGPAGLSVEPAPRVSAAQVAGSTLARRLTSSQARSLAEHAQALFGSLRALHALMTGPRGPELTPGASARPSASGAGFTPRVHEQPVQQQQASNGSTHDPPLEPPRHQHSRSESQRCSCEWGDQVPWAAGAGGHDEGGSGARCSEEGELDTPDDQMQGCSVVPPVQCRAGGVQLAGKGGRATGSHLVQDDTRWLASLMSTLSRSLGGEDLVNLGLLS